MVFSRGCTFRISSPLGRVTTDLRVPMALQLSRVIHHAHPRSEAGLYVVVHFATINIGGILGFECLIPGTKGMILEDIDALSGSVSKE